jgi:hypothetical protein
MAGAYQTGAPKAWPGLLQGCSRSAVSALVPVLFVPDIVSGASAAGFLTLS